MAIGSALVKLFISSLALAFVFIGVLYLSRFSKTIALPITVPELATMP